MGDVARRVGHVEQRAREIRFELAIHRRVYPDWLVVAAHAIVQVLQPRCLHLVLVTDASPKVSLHAHILMQIRVESCK